jgi:dethiobiotin synthetase
MIVVTGTGTGVGKTVVTAAIAALATAAGRRTAVLKPAQTGISGSERDDLSEVLRLAGDKITTRELRRYPDPLSPERAAARAGLQPVRPAEAAAAASELADDHDLVLIEGAGGLLVRFDPDGGTLADVAWSLGAPVLVVADAGLGTLNATTLTAEALVRRGVEGVGVVVGRWPAEPGLAERCNLLDLPVAAGAPLLGVLPEGAGELAADEFLAVARLSLSPWLDGDFDPEVFAAAYAPVE